MGNISGDLVLEEVGGRRYVQCNTEISVLSCVHNMVEPINEMNKKWSNCVEKGQVVHGEVFTVLFCGCREPVHMVKIISVTFIAQNVRGTEMVGGMRNGR